MRFLFAAALALFASSCSSIKSSCDQRKECLSGHDSCDDCAKDNYVEVCVANIESNLTGYATCDDDKCREAEDALIAYYDCLAAAECADYIRAADRQQDFTLCEAESNRANDLTRACREARKESCDF